MTSKERSITVMWYLPGPVAMHILREANAGKKFHYRGFHY